MLNIRAFTSLCYATCLLCVHFVRRIFNFVYITNNWFVEFLHTKLPINLLFYTECARQSCKRYRTTVEKKTLCRCLKTKSPYSFIADIFNSVNRHETENRPK